MNLTWQFDRRRIHYVTLKKASTLSCVRTFKVTFSAFYNDVQLRSALVMNGSLMRWASAALSLVRTPYCLPSAMTCPRIRTHAPRNFWRTLSLFRPSNPARALSSWKRSCCVKPCTLTPYLIIYVGWPKTWFKSWNWPFRYICGFNVH